MWVGPKEKAENDLGLVIHMKVIHKLRLTTHSSKMLSVSRTFACLIEKRLHFQGEFSIGKTSLLLRSQNTINLQIIGYSSTLLVLCLQNFWFEWNAFLRNKSSMQIVARDSQISFIKWRKSMSSLSRVNLKISYQLLQAQQCLSWRSFFVFTFCSFLVCYKFFPSKMPWGFYVTITKYFSTEL